jgi:NitT/TauT family transport system permease protein
MTRIPEPTETVVTTPTIAVESPLVRAEPRGSLVHRTLAAVIPPLVVLAFLIGVWYFVAYVVLDRRRRFLLHPPHQVIREGFLDRDNLAEILDGLWSSMRVAAVGLVISIVLGVFIAVVMSQAKVIERAWFPFLVTLQAIPILALVPMIQFWFGSDWRARVLVCVIISFFPIVLNTLFGLLSADAGLHDLITLHRGGRWTRLTKVMFPSALPAMFAGLRIAAGLSVIGAIVGDFFFGLGDVGLGQLIRKYSLNTNYGEQLLAAVIMSSLLGITVFLSFGALQHAVIGKWYDSKSGGGR